MKEKDIDEIRHNKKTGHWSWIFGRRGRMRESAGITHSKWHDKKKNVPMSGNIDPTDRRKSYFNPDKQYQHHRDYGNKDKRKDGWRMPDEDKKKIKRHFKNKKRTPKKSP